ncbi:MAG: TetR/AcrR family transcriptional regulator [Candidatus Bipolaricaulaceae bacterium]
MPRPFTDAERQAIAERLLAAGRRLFSRYGLRKTTVEEIARAAGIAKGTFYLFYPAKESLYADILLRAIPQMLSELIDRSFAATDDVREALVRYLKGLVELIDTDELVRAAVADPLAQARLLATIDVHDIQRRRGELLAPLLEAIATAQGRGRLVAGDPMEIVQILGVIKVLPLYKEQIPAEQYPHLVDRLAQVIADGLSCPAREEG